MQEESQLDKSPQRIRRMFDSIAPWYDFLNHFLSLGIDRSWRKKTVERLLTASLPPGDILDVCCGTGDLTLAFRRELHKKSEKRLLFGVDFSEKMIALAQKKAALKKENEVEIEFSVADTLALPFKNDSFSAVTVAFGLRNVGNTDQGLAEMVRVCKPGGTVAVLEFSMPTNPFLSWSYSFYFRYVLPLVGQLFTRNRDAAYRYLPESVLKFDSPKQIGLRMQGKGLFNVRYYSMTFGIATLIYATKATSR